MDYSKVTLDELKKGYRYSKDNNAYICNYCGQHFEVGQIFSIGHNLYTAEHAISKHIQMVHGGNLSQLISSDTKYNTLTQNQKDLITLFASGMSDKEMAKKLGVTEATIRRQRFTFREKAKQAKYYLAIYEQVFEKQAHSENAIIPIHNNAIYVDDRYLITEQERQHILETSFSSLTPLVLKSFSPNQMFSYGLLSVCLYYAAVFGLSCAGRRITPFSTSAGVHALLFHIQPLATL